MTIRRRGEFAFPSVKGGAWLVVGSLVAQAIALAATPILTRLYSPDSFGVLSVVLAASAVMAPAACFRLESALLLPRREEDAVGLLYLAGIIGAVSAVFTGTLLWILMELNWVPPVAHFGSFPIWVGLMVFFTASFALVSQFALRSQMFSAVARRSVYQAVVAAVGQVGLSRPMMGSAGLLTGQLMGRIAGIAPLVYVSRKRFKPVSVHKMWCLLREYRKFPLVFTPSTLLNGLGLALPLLFVGSYFSVSDAGQWGLADRVLAAPVALLGTAFGQVVETRFAARLRQGDRDVLRVFIRVSALLAVVALTVMVAIIVLAPLVLPWFFGAGWETAIELIQILSVATAFRLIAGPMAKVLVVLQRAASNLMLDMCRVASVGVAIAATVKLGLDLSSSAIAFTIAMAFVYLVSWFACLRAARSFSAGATSSEESNQWSNGDTGE